MKTCSPGTWEEVVSVPRPSGPESPSEARLAKAFQGGHPQRPTGLRMGDIGRLLAVWLVSSGALAVADALLPDMTAQGIWAYFAATVVAGLLGLVFRPLLVLVSSRLGWLAVLVYAAIWIVPGITASFWSAFWASWIVAVVATAAAWLGSAGTDDSFTSSLLRRRLV